MKRYEVEDFLRKNFKRIMKSYETYIKTTIEIGSIEDIVDIAEDIVFIKEFKKNDWDIKYIDLEKIKDKEEIENTLGVEE